MAQPQPTTSAAAAASTSKSSPSELLAANNEDVRDKFELLHVLGSGTFGQVRLAVLKEDRTQLRAVKVMPAENDEEAKSIFVYEIQFLQQLDHENIIRFYDFYMDHEFLYVVMELCTGGEVFKKILELKRFSEQNAAHLSKQMLKAIEYVHAAKIAHRDIKAENFMLVDDSASPRIKMIDFGMACRFEDGVYMTELCGSPHYLAPELIGHRYTCLADMWAFGVLLYLLMYGHYPYDAKHPRDLMIKVLTEPIRWQTKATLTDVCLDFLKKCLDRMTETRLTATAALAHTWIKEGSMRENQNENQLDPAILRSAQRTSTATRSKVQPKVEEQRNLKLKQLDEEFQKGIRHGQKLHAFERRPECVRRHATGLMTAPSGGAGSHNVAKQGVELGEAIRHIQASHSKMNEKSAPVDAQKDRDEANRDQTTTRMSVGSQDAKARDAQGRKQFAIESLPAGGRRRGDRFTTANPRRLAEVYRMSAAEEISLAALYRKDGSEEKKSDGAPPELPSKQGPSAKYRAEPAEQDQQAMSGVLPGNSGFLPGRPCSSSA